MSDEIKEALKQFNREDLINDRYEHNDLDTGITVSLTLKQMVKYNQLQSNWNSLREWINTRIQANIIRTGMRSEELLFVLDKMNELESGNKE